MDLHMAAQLTSSKDRASSRNLMKLGALACFVAAAAVLIASLVSTQGVIL